MKKIFLFWLIIVYTKINAQQLNIIPKPNHIEFRKGNYHTSYVGSFVLDIKNANTKKLYSDYLKAQQKKASIANKKKYKDNIITVVEEPNRKDEDYSIVILEKAITIGGNKSGLFYAFQTLRQIFEQASDNKIPCCTITDAPRFSYRGMHLDVGRHFQPVSFIKKYLDYMAMYKFNTFHWHLTEDQGWRIEIKKYPKLTQIGGFRNGTIIGRYPGTGNTNQRYGGFYTQEEIKEVVKYAADRNITVIPEIELPGHSSAAIAAYPELSCFPNEPTKIPGEFVSDASKKANGKLVQETWGVFEDVFCPSETTFNFLQDVMDEVMQLFPSKYIHIGGDECPKEAWKKSSFCQQLIKEKGLKDEHELQSYFIQRVEKYLNSKGRNIIGWDEILEGGLAPNATVMSWRGEKGGIEAAQQKHNVIMTPGSHCYFDHSQSRNEDSVTIGGYTTVEKVYSYEPIPKELNKEEAKYVLGAQGNVWTEYMTNPKKIEYQIFPRMLALSEVLWSDTVGRRWEEFEPRLLEQIKKLKNEKIKVSDALFDITTEISLFEYGKIRVDVSSKMDKPNDNINLVWKGSGFDKYIVKDNELQACHDCRTIDKKKDPTGKLGIFKDTIILGKIDFKDTRFQKFAIIDSSSTNTFILYSSPENPIKETKLNFSFNKATAQKITLTMPPSKSYPGNGGAFGLVNGLVSEKGINSTEWLGFAEGQDAEATIDLGKVQEINEVKIHTLDQQGSWIYLPEGMDVYTSMDGVSFTLQKSLPVLVDDIMRTKYLVNFFDKTNCRYVRIHIKNYGAIPSGQPGAGHQAWLFVDEIIVH